MRQAGRYQASYREIRKTVSFFDLCQNPEIAAQVTVTAVDELNVDAGIIFSDILVPVRAMGAPVELTEKGPKLASPIRTRADIDALKVIDPNEECSYVMESIRQACKAFDGKVPLIGFAGGPVTLASYLVEGGHSNNFMHLKNMLYADPETGHALLSKLATMIARHLRAQADAGCGAIQLFESWGGIFGPEDFREFAFRYHKQILDELSDLKVPKLLFGTGTAVVLEQLKEAGPDVVGVDWRIGLDAARERLGPDTPLQGNLDPCCLFMDEAPLKARIQRVLDQAGDNPGYIFNLGHGILPPTKPERARFLVDTVHELTRR